ncbi:MAG TPA: hypothetical protein VLH40_00865 [Atribacteraceae bacterium]|nr:hypothetical protein [Atribacteraceae bacterium]
MAYQKAGKKEKTMLDEFIRLTGYQRASAGSVLNAGGCEGRPSPAFWQWRPGGS